jgi:hypothetical protein
MTTKGNPRSVDLSLYLCQLSAKELLETFGCLLDLVELGSRVYVSSRRALPVETLAGN